LKQLTINEFARALKAAQVAGVKAESLTKNPPIVTANLVIKAETDAAPESRIIRFVASDETIDRAGDIIKVDGWKLDNYMKNPVFLWSHERDLLPIGKAVEAKIENGSLIIAVEFATAEHNPQAEQVYKLYRDGFLSAVSVGFLPMRWEFVDDESRNLGIDFIEQDLLELSAVTVPCNPNALVDDQSPPKHAPKHAPASVCLSYTKTRKEKIEAQ
jgi:HK97 family phage prohead protease